MNYTSASHLVLSCEQQLEECDGSSPSSYDNLRGPCSCAVGKDGMLVVCEWRGHSVSVVNAEGDIVTRFGNKEPTEESLQFRDLFLSQKQSSSQLFGSKAGQLHEPTGVAITADNHIAVCDSQNNRIQLFKFSGQPVALDSTQNPTIDPARATQCPYDIAIDSNGKMYISNPFKHTISVLTADMTFSHEVAKKGRSNAFTPLGIAIDSENTLYVCDRDSSCVLKLSSFGDPITTYKVDHLTCPVRVAVDFNGTVYVTYSYSAEIAMFANEGQYIGRFGGNCENSRKLGRPRGIAVGSDKIYVCDTANNQVVIF